MDAWLPSVDGCGKPGQIAMWIISLIFTLLFFILGIVDVANHGWYGYDGVGVVWHLHGKYGVHPLGMHEACWYIIYIFISLASLAGFIFILIIKKVDSETPVKPLFSNKIGKLHLVPLLCGFGLLCFNVSEGGDVDAMGVVALIFSIPSLIIIILVWVKDKPSVSDWKTWFTVKLFLGSLAFLHFNNFLESFNVFRYWHCRSHKCNDNDHNIAFQVVLCVLAMVGIGVWTILVKDVVVAFYGLLLFIGITAYGANGEIGKNTDYEITTLVVGLIGLVVVIVCTIIGIIQNKMKMLWG